MQFLEPSTFFVFSLHMQGSEVRVPYLVHMPSDRPVAFPMDPGWSSTLGFCTPTVSLPGCKDGMTIQKIRSLHPGTKEILPVYFNWNPRAMKNSWCLFFGSMKIVDFGIEWRHNVWPNSYWESKVSQGWFVYSPYIDIKEQMKRTRMTKSHQKLFCCLHDVVRSVMSCMIWNSQF